MSKRVGLIGTITQDVISSDKGPIYEGLGGILYQTAAVCGLKTQAALYTDIGEDLAPLVDPIIAKWSALDAAYVRKLSVPSNRVRLHYPERGERVEILESVVPALESDRVLADRPRLDMLVGVCNSGYDILLEEWRKIAGTQGCPIWFDVHSLALSKEIGQPRRYIPLPEWTQWIKDVTYVQANRMELSCMVGLPGKIPAHEDFFAFGARAFEEGVKAVFITLGRDGVLVMSPEKWERFPLDESVDVLDTTGCGDVFCAAAVAKLVRGADPFDAARFGLRLAARAARIKGIEETFALASQFASEV
jgi:hypothetical protein